MREDDGFFILLNFNFFDKHFPSGHFKSGLSQTRFFLLQSFLPIYIFPSGIYALTQPQWARTMDHVIPCPTNFDFVATNSDTIYPLQMATRLGSFNYKASSCFHTYKIWEGPFENTASFRVSCKIVVRKFCHIQFLLLFHICSMTADLSLRLTSSSLIL